MSERLHPGITEQHPVLQPGGVNIRFADLIEGFQDLIGPDPFALNIAIDVVGSGLVDSKASGILVRAVTEPVYEIIAEQETTQERATLVGTADHRVLTLVKRSDDTASLEWVALSDLGSAHLLVFNPRFDAQDDIEVTLLSPHSVLTRRVDANDRVGIYNLFVDSDDHAFIAGGFVHLGLARGN